jgi:hypothetical protein
LVEDTVYMTTYVYFRNDDVNTLDRELVEVTELLHGRGIPIIHAVEPANVRDDTVEWLLQLREKERRLTEIMQHGFDHRKRDQGEFGGNRPYEDQLRDLAAGQKIMREKFGGHFLNAVNFPFGPYNMGTIRAVSELGYEIVSSHYNWRLSRRILYRIGNLIGAGRLFGKHVSHHLRYYPGTRVFEIDMCISFIDSYLGGYHTSECVFNPLERILESYLNFEKHTEVIGFLIHHRYHRDRQAMDLIEATMGMLEERGVVFSNYSELFTRFAS